MQARGTRRPEGEKRSVVSFFLRIAMASRVERHLTEMAVAADVSESDFLILRAKGLTTPAALAFRIPSATDLEELLQHEVMPRSAYEFGDERGIVLFARDPPEEWASWKRSADAGALRLLYESAKSLCKKEVELRDSSEAPTKITSLVHSELVQKMERKGTVPSLGRGEVPGCHILAILQHNYSPNGGSLYIELSKYLSVEEEDRQHRLGLKKESFQKLTVQQGAIGLNPSFESYEALLVENVVQLQECLHLRSVAHEMLELVPYETYEKLHRTMMVAFTHQPPTKFRGPTIKEVIMVDRMIHLDALRMRVSGSHSLAEGLKSFLDNPSHNYWHFLQAVEETLPCRGTERLAPVTRTGLEKEEKGSLCRVCGKSREEHPRRRFCEMSLNSKAPGAEPRSDSRGKGKGKKGWTWNWKGGQHKGKGSSGGKGEHSPEKRKRQGAEEGEGSGNERRG